MQIQSLGWADPLASKWQPTTVFLPGKSHGQRGLVGYSPWGCKESDMTEQLSVHTSVDTKPSYVTSTETEQQEKETIRFWFEGFHLCPRKNMFGSRVALNCGLVD